MDSRTCNILPGDQSSGYRRQTMQKDVRRLTLLRAWQRYSRKTSLVTSFGATEKGVCLLGIKEELIRLT